MKVWFDEAEPNGEDAEWFDVMLGTPDQIDELWAWVTNTVVLRQVWADSLRQDLLIYLWLKGRGKCGLSKERLREEAIKYTTRAHEAERLREWRKNKKLVMDLTDDMPEFVSGFDFEDALAGLTERQQEVMKMLYTDGFTQAETADKLGVTQPAISQIRRKSIQAMREYLHG